MELKTEETCPHLGVTHEGIFRKLKAHFAVDSDSAVIYRAYQSYHSTDPQLPQNTAQRGRCDDDLGNYIELGELPYYALRTYDDLVEQLALCQDS